MMISRVGRLRDGHRQPMIVALGVEPRPHALYCELLFVDAEVKPGTYELVDDKQGISTSIFLDEAMYKPTQAVYEHCEVRRA